MPLNQRGIQILKSRILASVTALILVSLAEAQRAGDIAAKSRADEAKTKVGYEIPFHRHFYSVHATEGAPRRVGL